MEGNKDDAEKCIEFATRYFQDGNYEKAEKLLLKSERLFPTAKAKVLLERIRNSSNDSEEHLRRRKFSAPKKDETPFKTTDNNEHVEVNKEHMEAVKRVKQCKDYYAMLGVTKEATDSEIKKAYKKLALQLHPDKNKSTGANEAFKALGNAAGVLTDPEKRKQYDMFGSDETRMHNMQSRGAEQTFHYARGFEADVSAEELFNMFFGTGFPTNSNMNMRRNGRVYRTQENHGNREQQQGSGVLLQLFPILLLIILSMMSSFFVADPIYSLHQSNKFPIMRKTMNLKVPYYVKDSFPNEYQGSLKRLESAVEEEYVNSLRHACYKEKMYKDSLLFKAKTFNDRDMYSRAQSHPMPSCDALSHLQQSGHV